MRTRPFEIVHGVRVYLQPAGTLDRDLASSLVADPESEFHLLRHFSSVEPAYLLTLEGVRYLPWKDGGSEVVLDEACLRKALATPGSKFDAPGIFATPRDVVDAVRKGALAAIARGEVRLFEGPKSRIAHLTFEMPSTIGRDGVVPIRGERYEVHRRGALAGDEDIIKIVAGHPGIPTAMLSAVLGVRGPDIRLLTAFPGAPAPELPGTDQGHAERSYCRRFWALRAFCR